MNGRTSGYSSSNNLNDNMSKSSNSVHPKVSYDTPKDTPSCTLKAESLCDHESVSKFSNTDVYLFFT